MVTPFEDRMSGVVCAWANGTLTEDDLAEIEKFKQYLAAVADKDPDRRRAIYVEVYGEDL